MRRLLERFLSASLYVYLHYCRYQLPLRGPGMARSSKKSSGKRKPLKVRSNGKLRKAAGVNKRTGKVKKSEARKLAKGSGKNAQRARFYLNVLSKGGKRGGKKGGKKK